jgi:hypothetical protein
MNPKTSKIFVCVVVAVVAATLATWFYLNKSYSGCVLSRDEIEDVWGQGEFVAEEWKKATSATRRKMVLSIKSQHRNNIVSGKKSPEDVEMWLGPSELGFPDHSYPSYALDEGSARAEGWWLVFPKNRKVPGNEMGAEAFVWRKSCLK